MVKHLSFAVI